MSFPKKGRTIPARRRRRGAAGDGSGLVDEDLRYAMAIATALKRAHGNTHVAVKTAAAWAGANERTAKNWFAGRAGPCGDHLAELSRHSDEVLEAFLVMAGRRDILLAKKLVDARAALQEVLATIDRLLTDDPTIAE